MKELFVFVIVIFVIVWIKGLVNQFKSERNAEDDWCDEPNNGTSKSDGWGDEKPYITKNIYGAVETFATLCHMWKKNTGWAYEDADYAWISVTYSNGDVCLEMECRGDCMARQVPATFPELRAASDNIAVYKSNEVNSLDPKNPHALWEAYKAGSPNAVLQNISATSGSIFIQIKFNN